MLQVAKLMQPVTHLKSFLGSSVITGAHAVAHKTAGNPEVFEQAGVMEAGILVFGTSYIVLTGLQSI